MPRVLLTVTLAVLTGSCASAPAAAPDGGGCPMDGWGLSVPYPTEACTDASSSQLICGNGGGWECDGTEGCWIPFADGPCGLDAGL